MMDASQYDRMISAVERTTVAAAKKMMSWGTRLTLAFTLPLLGIGATATTEFASFDKAMTNSVSIMRGMTPALRKEMEQVALTLSGESTKSATQLAESYYFLASAGMNARQSIAAMPVVTRFAAAGAFDMARATDLLTDALTASGWALDETGANLSKLGDHIVLASVQANMSVEQFATSLTSDAGVAARNFGMEIETTMALLGAYASSGLKAEEAGTSFGRAVRLLTSAHRANGEAFKTYGVNVVDEATGKYRNFIDIIADLENSVGKMPPAMRDAALETMGFESLSQKAILPLIGMSEQMKIWEAEQRKAAGTMQSVSEGQLKAFSNQLTITKNKLTNISIEIGGRLAPYLLQLNQMIGRATLMWGSLSDETKNNIALYGTIAAAIGPLLIGFGMLLKVVGMGVAGFGLIFLPLVLGMSLLTRGFVRGASAGTSSFSRIRAAALSASQTIRSSFSAAVSSAVSSVAGLRIAGSQIASAYRTGSAAASTAVMGIARTAASSFSTARAWATSFANGWTGTLSLSAVRGGQTFNRIGAAAQVTFSRMSDYGRVAWSIVTGAAQAAFPNMNSTYQRMVAASQSAWSRVSDNAQFAWRRIQWVAEGALMRVQGAMGTTSSWISQQWSSVSSAVSARWSSALNRIVGVTSPIANRVVSLWSSAMTKLSNASSSSAGLIARSYMKLPAWLRGPLGQMASMVKTDAGKMGSVLSGAFARVSSMARGSASAVGTAWRSMVSPVASGIVSGMGGAFAKVKAMAVSTGSFMGKALRSPMAAMGRVGGAVGGLAMAGGMLGAMGIGGAFAPILATAPLAISLIGSLTAAVGSLLSPFLLLAGVIGVGAYIWATYTDSGQEALSSLGKGMEDYRAIGSQTFAGVKQALMAGDLSSAGAIAWAGLKAVWFTGVADLMENWGGFIRGFVEAFAGAMSGIGTLWNQTVGAISKKMLEMAGQEGILGDAMRGLIGVDPRQNEGDRKNIQRSGLSEQVRQWQSMIDLANQAGQTTIQLGSPDDPIIHTIAEVEGFIKGAQEKMQMEGFGLSAAQLDTGDPLGTLADMTVERQKIIDGAVGGVMDSFSQMANVDSLREQAAAAQASIGTLTGLIGKTKEAAEKSADLSAKVNELNTSLQQQVLTFGMDSTEAELLNLELAGATKEQLAQARALQGMLKEKEKLQKMEEDAKSIIDKNMTPMEKYNKTVEELGKLSRTAGADGNMLLDSMQYGRAMETAAKDLKDAQEQAQKEADEGIVAKFKVDTSGLKDAQTAMDRLRFEQMMAVKMEKPEKPSKDVSAPSIPEVGSLVPPSLGLSLPTAAEMSDLIAGMNLSDLMAINSPPVAEVPDLMAEISGFVDSTPSFAADSNFIPDLMPDLSVEVPSLMAEVPSLMAEVPSLTAEVPSLMAEVPSLTAEVPTANLPDMQPIEPTSMASSETIDISPMVDALSDIRDSMSDLVANTDPDNAAEPLVVRPLGLRG